MTKKVDVGIMLYGKPYQTAVSLHTLYKYSGHHINKIYVTIEKKQLFHNDTPLFKSLLEGLPIEYNVAKRFIGVKDQSQKTIKQYIKFLIPSYRKSMRYQYIWEKTKSPYLFLLHNDMLFSGDIIGHYLENIGDDLAVGAVGQCWNCPIYQKECHNDNYFDFRPNASEIVEFYKGWKVDRAVKQGLVGPDKEGWPMPECRLNEMVVMFNMKRAKRMIIPYGPIRPFATFNNLDFGIPWFRDISQRGYRLKHTSYDHVAEHAWCSNHSGGTTSLTNQTLYEKEEQIAKEYFEKMVK
ncbi:hypothetical protein EOJ36_11145 [Sandaracinomonas limnophila]|uniref:Glycosyltransferase n=1 Tax=Sandaracinomonas limnophila TaxID=1862386 RepID=A0A437PNK6_9BACT|nr:hypothetical protein [Sandaracinomonas limnophila]RVU23624.1 hypothetical protein EOJ36_11145 [Sandaracinomonas limnophila]